MISVLCGLFQDCSRNTQKKHKFKSGCTLRDFPGRCNLLKETTEPDKEEPYGGKE